MKYSDYVLLLVSLLVGLGAAMIACTVDPRISDPLWPLYDKIIEAAGDRIVESPILASTTTEKSDTPESANVNDILEIQKMEFLDTRVDCIFLSGSPKPELACNKALV
jgi:hypothetical protein